MEGSKCALPDMRDMCSFGRPQSIEAIIGDALPSLPAVDLGAAMHVKCSIRHLVRLTGGMKASWEVLAAPEPSCPCVDGANPTHF